MAGCFSGRLGPNQFGQTSRSPPWAGVREKRRNFKRINWILLPRCQEVADILNQKGIHVHSLNIYAGYGDVNPSWSEPGPNNFTANETSNLRHRNTYLFGLTDRTVQTTTKGVRIGLDESLYSVSLLGKRAQIISMRVQSLTEKLFSPLLNRGGGYF